jgi:hypothetical protein
LISTSTEIQITQSIVYFIAAAIPIYLTQILRNGNNHKNNNTKYLKLLTTVLTGFVLMQGFYHIVGALGFTFLAKGILEPLSFGILLFFGIIYLINRSKMKEEKVKV